MPSGSSTSSAPLLYSPYKLRGLELKNRLVVPPMVHYRAEEGAKMGDWHLVHLGRYGLGGFGLVFVEATAVDPLGLITEYDLGLWSDDQIPGFKRLTDYFHSEGSNCKIGIQLAHGGRKASSQRAPDGMGPLTAEQIANGAKCWTPVGPTDVPTAEGWLKPRMLTTEECEEMVEKWKSAAERAVKAGFDTVEIHMAHGYLLASFLSPISNTRTDKYGGSFENRVRLPLEIARAIRSVLPSSMPLFVRISSVDGAENGWNMDDSVAFSHLLKEAGVDIVDCSSGGLGGSATALPVPRALGFQLPYACRIKREVQIPTMAVGIILHPEQAESYLEKGECDLIAIGRQAQYNPSVALHWSHDLGLNGEFEGWQAEFGWWLNKRRVTIKEFAKETGEVVKPDW